MNFAAEETVSDFIKHFKGRKVKTMSEIWLFVRLFKLCKVLNQSKEDLIIPFNRRCLAGLFFIISNFLAFVNISDAEWSIQVADEPKSFYGTSYCEPSSRAIAINASNHPHIVYGGGSGLYYACYDGSSWQEREGRYIIR